MLLFWLKFRKKKQEVKIEKLQGQKRKNDAFIKMCSVS